MYSVVSLQSGCAIWNHALHQYTAISYNLVMSLCVVSPAPRVPLYRAGMSAHHPRVPHSDWCRVRQIHVLTLDSVLLRTCTCTFSSISRVVYTVYTCVVGWFESHLRQLIFSRKSDCLGCAVLLCLVCLLDLACFFLSSFSSLIKNMYM